MPHTIEFYGVRSVLFEMFWMNLEVSFLRENFTQSIIAIAKAFGIYTKVINGA